MYAPQHKAPLWRAVTPDGNPISKQRRRSAAPIPITFALEAGKRRRSVASKECRMAAEPPLEEIRLGALVSRRSQLPLSPPLSAPGVLPACERGHDGGRGAALLRQQVEGVPAERELLGVEARVLVVGRDPRQHLLVAQRATAVLAF